MKKAYIAAAALVAAMYAKRSFFMYGLTSDAALIEAAELTVQKLGGGENAKRLLLETAAAETDWGRAVDNSWGVGVGVMQFDPIAFYDVQERTSRATKQQVIEAFGPDFDIERATLQMLRWSPLASMIFARLKYKLIPDPIPDTVQGRAIYWKQYYNSIEGAGTPRHYIDSAARRGLA